MSSLRAYSDLNASLCTIPLVLFRFRDAHIHKYSNDLEATRLRWEDNAKRRKTFKIREKLKKNYHVQRWNISMTFAKKLLFCLPSLASFFFFFYEYGVDYSCATTCSSLDLCCNIHLFRQVQSYTCGFVVLSYTWLFSCVVPASNGCTIAFYDIT